MAKVHVPTDLELLRPIVEAMIFASEDPISPRNLLRILYSDEEPKSNGDSNEETGGESEAETEIAKGRIGQKELREIIDQINDQYEETGRAFRIIEIAGGFQYATVKAYGAFVGLLSRDKAKRRLTPASLETLSIVAYRQPVTKPEIESIRGVNCDQVLFSLLERNLIAIGGRADSVGKPLLYGTTDEFLRAFGLNSLRDLPKLRELEELMEDDTFSPTKPEVISDEVTSALLELPEQEEPKSVGIELIEEIEENEESN